jgi:hypothetical protein
MGVFAFSLPRDTFASLNHLTVFDAHVPHLRFDHQTLKTTQHHRKL